LPSGASSNEVEETQIDFQSSLGLDGNYEEEEDNSACHDSVHDLDDDALLEPSQNHDTVPCSYVHASDSSDHIEKSNDGPPE
jgi:hypothetical protein